MIIKRRFGSCKANTLNEKEVILKTLIDWKKNINKDRDEKLELTRGLFNNNITKIAKTKEERRTVKEIWERCHLKIWEIIWLERCNKVIELEKAMGINKTDKKKRKRIKDNIEEINDIDGKCGFENIEKIRKKLIIDNIPYISGHSTPYV
ncbi:hypothetical protein RhiirA1_448896 [Rhizophagus irregularis]|uniref:Uncharacterized protein n=1 Tax=Rhizophagus irregularis TaxID=588596 RepID=A0A2N0SIC6_9GLOM|nr:hypothetical protein RhiirA1_448896 [Rhizophagus irregularis]